MESVKNLKLIVNKCNATKIIILGEQYQDPIIGGCKV